MGTAARRRLPPRIARRVVGQRRQQSRFDQCGNPACDDIGGRLEARAAQALDEGDDFGRGPRPLAQDPENGQVEQVARGQNTVRVHSTKSGRNVVRICYL
jgi:hypothetical protein